MEIVDVILSEETEEKLNRKHNVTYNEIIEVFRKNPKFLFEQKGHYPDEHLYSVWGQTIGGRYLISFFIYKKTKEALLVSSREMNQKERERYAKK
ncbi:MAG TPA: BrnT family toxin [Spirochaetes bacterium]|nr:BrnT family toxin [Spirochaetota bacterium]